MKTLMTTAAVLALLTAPVFAQGGQSAGSESRGEPQASGAKESAKDPAEKGAMGQQTAPRATTGAASDSSKKDPTKESAGSSGPPEKTGVTTGGDSGGGGSGSGSK
jgi:hypothetical protein